MHAEKSYLIIYLFEQKPKNSGDQSGRNHWSNKKKTKIHCKTDNENRLLQESFAKNIFNIDFFQSLSLSQSILNLSL